MAREPNELNLIVQSVGAAAAAVAAVVCLLAYFHLPPLASIHLSLPVEVLFLVLVS